VEELHKIKKHHKNPELVLRIRNDDDGAQFNLGIKFGCDPPIEKGEELLLEAKRLGLPVIGISFHVGSGCQDQNAYSKGAELAKQLFVFGEKHGHGMSFLDFGGGFPGNDTKKITFDRIAKAINSSLEEHFPEKLYPASKLKIIAEPGRFFAFATISIVAHVIGATRVPASRITKKKADEKKDGYMYYLNDGVYGSFNSIVFDGAHIAGKSLLITRNPSKDETTYPSIVWGPTCAGHDVVEKYADLKKLTDGDWLYYTDMGAYSTVSASHFNGFKSPTPYYIMDDSTWHSIYGKGDKKKADPCSAEEYDVDHKIVDLFN